jgi:hypothetical protein
LYKKSFLEAKRAFLRRFMNEAFLLQKENSNQSG